MSGFDLGDADAGIFASAHDGGVAFIVRDEEMVASAPASFSADSLGEGPTRQVTIDGHSLCVDIEQTGTSVLLEGELSGSIEIAPGRASGLLSSAEGEARLDCPAASISVRRPPSADLLLRRFILAFLADGGMLALAAARPAGTEEHDAEEVIALVRSPSGEAGPPPEVLLSTAYDDAGHHTRATVELWPQEGSEEKPSRGGGTRIGGGFVATGDWRVETALFGWSVDGRPGLGRYEIARRS